MWNDYPYDKETHFIFGNSHSLKFMKPEVQMTVDKFYKYHWSFIFKIWQTQMIDFDSKLL